MSDLRKTAVLKLTLLVLYYSLGKPEVVFSEDEEYKRVSYDKFAALRPAFLKENG